MRQHTSFKYILRLMAVLVLTLAVTVASAATAHADGESGSCGENLNWSITGGTLTITGSGDMTDYTLDNPAPWYELREEIYFVILPEGMTSVGEMAFYECGKLQRVKIPNSVTGIGKFAFAYCADLVMLDLGSGVSAIGEAAFTDCYDLATLRLPDSLRMLGKKAFYRCESLSAITVPTGITELGVAAFGYCKALVTADVRAQVDELPTLLFYGCDRLNSVKLPESVQSVGYHAFLDCEQLSTVYYNGTQQTPEQIQQSIGADVPGFEQNGTVSDADVGSSAQSGALISGSDEAITYENTTVTQGSGSSVTTTVTTTQSTTSGQVANIGTDVSVSLENEAGWKEAADAVQDALGKAEANAGADTQIGTAEITVYLKDGESLDKEFLDSLAGKNVAVTVVTQSGVSWRVDGKDIDPESKAKSYDFGYELTAASDKVCRALGVSTCYVLRFDTSVQIKAELMVPLGGHLALQNATLLKGKDYTEIQSAVVDQDGYAHFFLGSVDKRGEYYIAINLPGTQSSAIVPDTLADAYGKPENYQPIQYEITGRTSSWGMTLGQVTWIMVAVLLGCAVTVGAVMFTLNKRKLRRGYIPDLGDEE